MTSITWDTPEFKAKVNGAHCAQFHKAFELADRSYPVVDEFEQRMGFAVDRERLEDAAGVLACLLKKNPPKWQHGRVLYALARN